MCQIKIFILIFFPILKFYLSAFVNKQTFLVQTMAFQAKLPSHYVFQSRTLWL